MILQTFHFRKRFYIWHANWIDLQDFVVNSTIISILICNLLSMFPVQPLFMSNELCLSVLRYSISTLRWRPHKHRGVWNHRQLQWLNCLFCLTSTEIPNATWLALWEGKPCGSKQGIPLKKGQQRRKHFLVMTPYWFTGNSRIVSSI